MTTEISIVILTRNSLGVVERLIEAIRAQEFNLPFELLFMENNSSDGTLEYLNAIRDMPVRIIPVGEGKFSHSGTRMEAARLAAGRAVVFFTDDVVPIGQRFSAKADRPGAGQPGCRRLRRLADQSRMARSGGRLSAQRLARGLRRLRRAHPRLLLGEVSPRAAAAVVQLRQLRLMHRPRHAAAPRLPARGLRRGHALRPPVDPRRPARGPGQGGPLLPLAQGQARLHVPAHVLSTPISA